MGVSTNAILFYGVHFDPEADDAPEWPWGYDGQEFEDDEGFLQAKLGLEKPETGSNEKGEWDNYWKAREKALKEIGVRWNTHCSDSYPMPYVSVEESRTVARRGYPEAITNLAVGADWDEKLRRWFALVGVPFPAERVGWWLVSYWR